MFTFLVRVWEKIIPCSLNGDNGKNGKQKQETRKELKR